MSEDNVYLFLNEGKLYYVTTEKDCYHVSALRGYRFVCHTSLSLADKDTLTPMPEELL
jgi:hypothetical protein